jgi:DinB superfamily
LDLCRFDPAKTEGYSSSLIVVLEGKTQMDPRYPIGEFAVPATVTPARRQQAIDEIAATPAKMRAAVKGLNDAQLDTPYREGGWSVRQVVHHVPDSHMNAYIRLRLALTEDNPTIRPYEQQLWAHLADAKMPIEVSQTLLDCLHARWDCVWRSMKPTDFARPLVHPEYGGRDVDWLLFLYEWHGKHHTAHITELRKQKGW